MRSFIASCFVLCVTVLEAQTPAATAFYYSASNGLADNDVQSILQDSRGFIWIGTREGLSRYDGKKFESFFHQANDSASLPLGFSTFVDVKKTTIASGMRITPIVRNWRLR